MSSSTIDTEEMLALIDDKIQHSYIEKYIEKPVIDENKLYVLISILNKAAISECKKKQYIITAMLVQIALDTHELVPIKTSESNKVNKTKKQLFVLAGDYYSGLYYSLLADIEDVNMIQSLAAAIKEINEYKMNLYYGEYNTFQDFVKLTGKIETLLIKRVAESMDEQYIIPLVEEWLTLIKLIREKEKMFEDQYSSMFEYWFLSTSSGFSSISSMLDRSVNTKVQNIESLLGEVPSQYGLLEFRVRQQLKQIEHNSSSLVEEG
ncbi:heptaprenyl diphosphate synthase component 1 [Virgibacillus sp. W0181]|uniref:heptaprenyl diphosphate synthase component 1 n=1 Tax=Virgibacillus sp. W0181 TaxID=3391581 RepID=UPI003F454B6C